MTRRKTMADAVPSGLWDEIAKDALDEGFVRRRIHPELAHDVFLGERRPSGQRVLELVIKGPVDGIPDKRPASRGLDVQVAIEGSSQARIRLVSTMVMGDSIFTELVSDVVAVLLAASDDHAAAKVVERVVAWQNFLARKGDPISQEQTAGLFAELLVLQRVLLPWFGPSLGVQSWTGPDPALQDFQLGADAVEVKSYRGNGSGQLKISSERQLDGIGSRHLFVGYVELDERADGTGVTVADMVDEVRGLVVQAPSAHHALAGKLLKYPWHDSYSQVRSERYEVRALEFFVVGEGFPRIVGSNLPNGVGDVRYTLDRSALEAFLISTEELRARLLEGSA
jgi:hypothetical protein